MPPVEAMMFGANVVTTQCASIPEVTQDKAVYVQDPYDAEEWIQKIEEGMKGVDSREKLDDEPYALENIATKYLRVLLED